MGYHSLFFNNYGSFCVRDMFNKYHPSGVPVQKVAQVNIKAEKFIYDNLILPNWEELTSFD